MNRSMRLLVSSLVVVAATVATARPKPTFIEIKSLPTSVKGLAQVVEKEKPGAFRTQAVWALETKLREKGDELTDPDAVDALVGEMLQRIVEDMAANSEIYMWEGDEAPRGDVLIRDPVLLLPGRTSTGFAKKYTVRPMGRRIDRGYRNSDCTMKVSVAKSPADWFSHVESKGWGIAVQTIRVTDGVARVVLHFVSKGGTEPPSARHERPVWVAFFRQEAAGGPWLPVLFNPAGAKLQRDQETTLLPADPKEKLTDTMKQHVLAIRVGDLALINPARSTLHESEARWTSLNGLSGSVIDAKNVAWLEPLRMSDDPLLRAAGTLKAVAVGGTVSTEELIDVLVSVKLARVQAEALLHLNKLLDAATDASADDLAALSKLAQGETKVAGTVARVKTATGTKLFKKGANGWESVTPKK